MKRTIFIDAEQDGKTYAQIIGKPDWTDALCWFCGSIIAIAILIELLF